MASLINLHEGNESPQGIPSSSLIFFSETFISLSMSENFFKCVPSPLYDPDFEEKQEKLETLFLTSYDKIYMGFEDQADNEGVGDGFRLLCSIFLEVR